MIEFTRAHILALVSCLRTALPTNVFGITCRFTPKPPGMINEGKVALEILTVGLYSGPHLLHDVVSWIELEEVDSQEAFAVAINETMHAHVMAHRRNQDEIDGTGPFAKVRK